MTDSDDAATSPTLFLPLAEAASRLGLHPSALRSRIRRGQVTAKRGNDKRLLVEVMANVQPRHEEAMASPDDELAAEIDQLRSQLESAHLAVARAEGARDTAVATSTAKVDAAERIITELRAMLDIAKAELADARRPWWRRLVGR
jgi:DNA-binding Lrp family transcriptional regulator